MRGLTRREFDGLREAERDHGAPAVFEGDIETYTAEELAVLEGLITRGLVRKAECPHCPAEWTHAQLTPSGKMMLTLARTPESGIIQCDPSP
jgi:hypothetical protein